MRKLEEEALELFSNSHNCSQSVLAVLGNKLGITEHQAISLASGFGAGICFQGQACGAVTGAYMAIGLQSGHMFSEGESIKENTYHLIRKFNAEFKSQYGTTNCNQLLGIDISTQNGVAEAIEKGLFKTKCPQFVGTAVSICKQLLDIND